jgi:hypothetical protein
MPTTCAQGRGPVRILATALAVAGALALAPAANADTTTIAPTGSGITAPAGIARDSNGALWVADALRGVCKVNPALPGSDALVTDGTWCRAGAPVEGGIVVGPQAPFQMAYDAPSSTLFVAEGASHSMGVWRFHIDPATSTIAGGTKIVFESDRVFGLAIGTDSGGGVVVDYSTKRSPLIHQIPNAVACSPCAPIIAGSAQTAGAPSLAVLGTSLYIAEAGVVTRLDNPGPSGGVAQPIAGFPGAFSNALAVDPVRGRVYAGSANALNPAAPNGSKQDQVDVLTPSNGAVETYATGFSGVTALSVAPDGTLLVGDDPQLAAATPGHGRLFAVGLGNLGTPKVTITGGPTSFTPSHSVVFTFTTAAGMSFECRLDAAATDPWVPCGTGPSGSFSVPNASEGAHTFEVRAVSPDPAIGPGASQKRTFIVDGTAPSVSVDNPSSDATLAPGSTSMTLRFSSNDGSATFSCSLDGQAPLLCSDPKTYTGLTVGDHAVTVSATDAAGNASTPATFRFTVTPAPAPAPSTPGPGSRTTVVPSKPAGPAGATAPRLTSGLKLRSARLIRARTTLSKLRSKRRIAVRIVTPAGARAVTLALWKGTEGTVPVAQSSLRVAGAHTHQVVLTLTGRVAKRLRAGHYLVGVTLGDGGSLYGPARFLRLTVAL